ncbi:MAG TPA: hypothetical protein VKB88_23120 [Bryobacteraceae bacterium]|nr:hypothetical protein [Bryobacteraceae bacterium]
MIIVKFASASALALAGTLLWAQAPGSFVTIDVPGAVSTTSSVGSDRLKINAQGQIVGGYTDTLGKTHGFLLSNGNFTTFDYPGAVYTTLNDISPGGDTLLGIYQDASLMFHGFLLSQGNLSTIDVPGAGSNIPGCSIGCGTQPLVLSPEGDVGGVFSNSSGDHGFVLSGGTFTQIDFPGSVFSSVQGVNAGRIVGAEVSGGRVHAYELVNGTFTQFDFPGSVFTGAADINAAGTIVGEYYTPDGVSHGYKLERGQFTTVDVPGAVYQWANGISITGTIVGKYKTPDGKFHGYELY